MEKRKQGKRSNFDNDWEHGCQHHLQQKRLCFTMWTNR